MMGSGVKLWLVIWFSCLLHIFFTDHMMGSGVKLWLVIWFSCLLHRPYDGKWSKTMIGYMIFMSSSQTIWWKWSKTMIGYDFHVFFIGKWSKSMIGYMIFMSSSQTWDHVFFTDHMMGSGVFFAKLWLVIWFSCLLRRPDDGKWSKTMIGYMISISSSQTIWWEVE